MASDGAAGRALGSFARVVLPIAVGIGLGYLLLTQVFLDRISLGRIQRIIEISRHLESPMPDKPWAVFIGDSLHREGIDTEIVEESASQDLHATNFAVGGFDITEHQILLPRLLHKQPDLIVLSLSLSVACTIREVDIDKAYAYAHAGFVEYWPEDWDVTQFTGIGEASYDALRSSPLRQHLYFRTAPVNSFDHGLRLRLRSGLRPEYVSDFERPHEYVADVNKRALDEHLTKVNQTIGRCNPRADDRRLAGYQKVIELISAGGAKPILVINPIYPAVREQADEYLAYAVPFLSPSLARTGGAIIDTRALLSEEQFVDATHPNSKGRAVLSRAVGQQLPAL
jgi:lysophospholipase L1-like esterase